MTGPGGSGDEHDVVGRTDRGLTPTGDTFHRDYVLGKIPDNASPSSIGAVRDPQSWQRQVEQWGDQKTLHDMMMYGHQIMMGRTAEQGWRTEHARPTPFGTRRHDVALIAEVFGKQRVLTTTEYKAGSVNREDGLKQLRKEDHLLRTGQTQQVSEYVIRAARPPHPDVMREAQRLAQAYPTRFKIIALSEKEFDKAVELGRPIVRALAVERLGKVIEQVGRTPELTAAFRALRGAGRAIDQAKRRGTPLGLHKLLGVRDKLANLIELDQQQTQQIDKTAREQAGLGLRDSLVVEHAQAHKRQQRLEAMTRMLSRVDQEIVGTATRKVAAEVPLRDRRNLRKQLQWIRARDVGEGRSRNLAVRIREFVTVTAELGAHYREEREQEQQALARLVPARYRDAATKALEQRRSTHDRDLVADLTRTADHTNALPPPKTPEQIRAEERARAARQAKALQKDQLLTRIVDDHNKRVEQAAREQAQQLRSQDPATAARTTRQVERAAAALSLDKQTLAKQVDPRAIQGLLQGQARWDRGTQAYTLEVGPNEKLYFGPNSFEAYYADQIREVERGQDLGVVETNQLLKMSSRGHDLADSLDKLERDRAEVENKQREARERGTQFRTTGPERQERGRGQERGR
ncbi:hypothetical protein ACFWM1_26590 [Nocardia sp. NPDC058379]|uniref:hypothetical protein n=1 Tax=unclassified Nocardia TaxID=2637762 RepID=UPI00365F4EB7